MRKCLVASAMRCVSSFFLTAFRDCLPRSRISAERRSIIVFSPRPRQETINDCQGATTLLMDLNRHLVRQTADAPRLNFHGWRFVDRSLENLQRLFRLFTNLLHSAVEDSLGGGFLSAPLTPLMNLVTRACCIQDRATLRVVEQFFVLA